SATMASEAAVLGVPAVYVSPVGRGYTDEQETRYGLVRNFTGDRFAHDWLPDIAALADDPDLPSRARGSRERLLAEKIDTTQWMIDFFAGEYARRGAAVQGSNAPASSSIAEAKKRSAPESINRPVRAPESGPITVNAC